MGRKFVKKILPNEAGATAIEYALIAAVVFLASAGALTAMSDTLQILFNDTFPKIARALDNE